MTDPSTQNSIRPTRAVEKALNRILAEIEAGLRHGYFDIRLTCDLVGNGRRRLTLRAGRNYQFLVPAEDCCQEAESE
jgi:hypothetical protein